MVQILQGGDGVQRTDWVVKQENAAGYARIYYIKSGEVTYHDNGIKLELKSGSLYVFPSSLPYRIMHNPNKPINCLWFHVDVFPYDIDRILEFNLSERENHTMSMIISALDSEYNTERGKNQLYLLLTEAMIQLIIRHPQVRKPDASLIEILGYIRENIFSDTLSVKEVSKKFGYSQAHFIRLFHSGMNITPHQYIIRLRITAAAKLIEEGATASQAAVSCGYNDYKNFAKAFKKYYGIAPSQYLKLYVIEA